MQRQIIGKYFLDLAFDWFSVQGRKEENIEDLLGALEKQFQRSGRQDHIMAICQCQQQMNETVADYSVRLQSLIQKSGVNYPDEDTTQQFIIGLQPVLRNAVIDADPQSFNEALRIAQRKESGIRYCDSINSKNGTVATISPKTKGDSDPIAKINAVSPNLFKLQKQLNNIQQELQMIS